MAASAEKVERQAAAVLAAGERVVAVLAGYPRGVVEQFLATGAGGAVLGGAGAAAGAQVGAGLAAPHHQAAAAAGVATDGAGAGVVLALTDRRVLVFRAGLLGRVKELLGALDRRDVLEVALGTRRLAGQAMPEVVVRTAAGELGVGVGRVHRAKAEAFVAAAGSAAAL